MSNSQPVYNKVYTSPATFDSCALVTGNLASNANGSLGAVLIGGLVENTNAATRWIQFFDGYAQPASGTVPIFSLKLSASTQESITVPSMVFHNGIVVASSTTGPTYTAGSSDMFLTLWWCLP